MVQVRCTIGLEFCWGGGGCKCFGPHIGGEYYYTTVKNVYGSMLCLNTLGECTILYSGKFSCGAKFSLFADGLATVKIRTAKVTIATHGRCNHMYNCRRGCGLNTVKTRKLKLRKLFF